MSKKTMKNSENEGAKLPVFIAGGAQPVGVIPEWCGGRVTPPTSIKQARRLLSKLISGFIKGQIAAEDSRTLAYLLGVFVGIAKDSDIFERLEKIESQLLQNGASNETF